MVRTVSALRSLGLGGLPSPPSLDDLAALDSTRRRELAAALRSVAETLAEVRDGMTASQVVGVLAHLLDPT